MREKLQEAIIFFGIGVIAGCFLGKCEMNHRDADITDMRTQLEAATSASDSALEAADELIAMQRRLITIYDAALQAAFQTLLNHGIDALDAEVQLPDVGTSPTTQPAPDWRS